MTVDRIPATGGNAELRAWWRASRPERVREVCAEAGISYDHFKNVAAGRRRMSPAKAAVFVKASHGRLKFQQLMPPLLSVEIARQEAHAKRAAKRAAKAKQKARL